MTYDGLDRLHSAAIAGDDGGATTTYSYDALNRITQVAQGSRLQTYIYDAHYPGRLTSVNDSQAGTTSYSYDAQGNLTQRNGVQYQFDDGNRLRAVTGRDWNYAYDAWGRRVVQTNASGVIESFYDHTGKLIYRRDRDGGTHDYLYLGGKLVAIRDYDSGGIARNWRYQHTDALGSIIQQTDKQGNDDPGAAVVYDAWGGMHGSSPQDEPGYTGHVQDADTGLVYMQQRYYDPEVGRFLSVDPVGASATNGSNLDRYWYASDNPYRYTDPTGEAATQPIPAPGACNAGSACPHGGDQAVPQAANKQEVKKIGPDGSLESKSPGLAAFISGLSTSASALMEDMEAIGPQKALGVLGPIGVGIELLVVPGPMGAASCETSSTPCRMMSQTPDVPSIGPPGQWVNGKRRSRLYGTDGRPKVDIDNPHQGADYPHVHEWGENGVREHPGREVPDLPPPEPESSS